MERSCPSHSESIWQCIEIPDHPTAAPVRVAARRLLGIVAAALTPPESSNRMARMACVVSFVAKRPRTSSTVPASVEKNTMYAQMSRVLMVAFFTAEGSIPASKWIFVGVDTVLCHLSVLLLFCIAYIKIPPKSAEKIVTTYRNVPNFASFHKVAPTVLMRNAEDGMDEQANTRSHSLFSIVFFS